MRKIQCENCEGDLTYIGGNIWRCNYCGTQYEIEPNIGYTTKLTIVKQGCRVIKSQFAMEHEMEKHFTEEQRKEIVKREIVRKLQGYMLEHFDEMFDMHEDTDYRQMIKRYEIIFRYLDKTDLPMK